MRPLEFLKTTELQEKIIEDLNKIKGQEDLEKQLNFKEPVIGSEEGRYVFADTQGYHYIVSERGQKIVNKVTDDLFDIKFWVIYPIVVTISFDFSAENSQNNDDPRIVAFPKQLALLKEIDQNLFKRGEIEQDEILKTNPIL
ncbi:Imm63 family immunity protein [Listeria aquatica]|uniref:Imm63 family immunity protein n=1 Tax=Listeria aquatica TaxID=1494960 RepID=UPI003F6F404D